MMTREDVHKARALAHAKYICGEMEHDGYIGLLDFLCSLEDNSELVDQNSPEVIIDASDFLREYVDRKKK